MKSIMNSNMSYLIIPSNEEAHLIHNTNLALRNILTIISKMISNMTIITVQRARLEAENMAVKTFHTFGEKNSRFVSLP